MQDLAMIRAAAARIDREMSPSRAVLFGSRARNAGRKDSDVDLLVVFSREVDPRQVSRDARWLLRDVPLAFDVVVATEDDLGRRGDQIGLVYRQALREGKALLGSRPTSCGGHPSTCRREKT